MDNQFVRVPGHHSRDPRFKARDLPVPRRAVQRRLVVPPIPDRQEHQLAAKEEPAVSDESMPKPKPTPIVKPGSKPKFWKQRKFIIASVSAVILLAAAGFGYWHYFHHKTVKKSVAQIIQNTKSNAPLMVASSLSGLPVSPEINKLPITAVMIENSTDARPQSGLSQAGVVFEALAEGGITRFVALFQGDGSASIGPVRSARPYFISWILGFDAAYAHVGGSPEALSDITSWNVKNMDQFYNASYYQRVSNRAAPHNVYTTLDSLYQLEQSKGYTSSTFNSWPRKTSTALAKPTAASIDLTLSSSEYNVSYAYDSSTNSYNRDDGGTTQVDADTNQQLSPNVVIAIVVPESNGPLDGIGAYYSEYQTVGSGTAYIFQDGGVTEGQWSKTSNNSNVQFTNASGQSLPLNPGQVWVTAVSTSSAVSYN